MNAIELSIITLLVLGGASLVGGAIADGATALSTAVSTAVTAATP